MRLTCGFWIGLAAVVAGVFSDDDAACAQTVFYVDVDADAEPHDGSTWCHAFLDLQQALTAASNSQLKYEIRVAGGTYKAGAPPSTLQSFRLKSGVAVYGGFAGCGAADSDERNLILYETVLSGDLLDDDDPTPSSNCCSANGTQTCDVSDCATAVCAERLSCCNSEWDELCGAAARVLCCGPCGNRCDNTKQILRGDSADGTAVLDGFTITGGNANGPNPRDRGGGYYSTFIAPSRPVIRNCVFRGNAALAKGGAMANERSDVQLINCLFVDNVSKEAGAIYNSTSAPRLENCTASENVAYVKQGGIENNIDDSPAIINSILWRNQDASGMGESAQINFTIGTTLTLNYSCVQGLTGDLGGVGNVSDDPLFVDPDGVDGLVGTSDDDFRLNPASPLIDRGDPLHPPSPCETDLDLESRVEAGRIDLGSFEDGSAAPPQDANLDLGDFASFQQCIGAASLIPCLCAHDADGNGVVEVSDLAGFIAAFTGPS